MNFYVVVVFENGLSNQMFVMPNGFKSRVELDSLEKDAEKTLKSMKNIYRIRIKTSYCTKEVMIQRKEPNHRPTQLL